uniref:Uncharacterized protein n=1 Tax=Laticauda laticaudata TaxID=8630 RepID=A0A8C5WT67_LATLA
KRDFPWQSCLTLQIYGHPPGLFKKTSFSRTLTQFRDLGVGCCFLQHRTFLWVYKEKRMGRYLNVQSFARDRIIGDPESAATYGKKARYLNIAAFFIGIGITVTCFLAIILSSGNILKLF